MKLEPNYPPGGRTSRYKVRLTFYFAVTARYSPSYWDLGGDRGGIEGKDLCPSDFPFLTCSRSARSSARFFMSLAAILDAEDFFEIGFSDLLGVKISLAELT